MSDDLIARGDGSFTVLRDGRLFDLVFSSGLQRQWVSVDTPFVPVKLASRPDHTMFALADDGSIWQRERDRHEHHAGEVTIHSQWRQIARAPS
jgi:hypothetical protein